jgi:phage tail tape-measure protein
MRLVDMGGHHINWIGAVAGAILGSARGGGIVGGIIGSLVGNWVEEKVRAYLKKPSPRKSSDVSAPPPRSASPYDILGVDSSASDEEVKCAYREKVKHLHPDTLRGKDLPDEVIDTVSERMAQVNAAWAAIRRERSL